MRPHARYWGGSRAVASVLENCPLAVAPDIAVQLVQVMP